MSKRKIGSIKGMPVVEGYPNEVTKHEYHYKEDNDGNITLSKRDSKGNLESTGGDNSSNTGNNIEQSYDYITFDMSDISQNMSEFPQEFQNTLFSVMLGKINIIRRGLFSNPRTFYYESIKNYLTQKYIKSVSFVGTSNNQSGDGYIALGGEAPFDMGFNAVADPHIYGGMSTAIFMFKLYDIKITDIVENIHSKPIYPGTYSENAWENKLQELYIKYPNILPNEKKHIRAIVLFLQEAIDYAIANKDNNSEYNEVLEELGITNLDKIKVVHYTKEEFDSSVELCKQAALSWEG